MDHPDERRELARLARRIADGQRVDWDTECTQTEVTADQVKHLKLVERISEAHKRLAQDELPFESWGPLDLRHISACGSFGDVYRARDRNLDRDVALKLLASDDGGAEHDRFVAEARRLALVRHPNVVTVYGADRFEGRSGIWMDWIDGETLEARVEDEGPVSAIEAAGIGVQLCGALAAIHAAGLVHRDIKLSNVMRERGGRVVLMDFGSSTRGERPRVGTPMYLPPESFEGEDSGTAADIYALGVCLYRLTCTDYPLELGNSDRMRRAHREGALVPLRDRNPDLPAGLLQIVERAMHRDPKQRYGSAGEMEQDLRSLIHPTSGGPPIWRRPVFGVAALLLVAAVSYAVFAWTRQSFDADAAFFRVTERGTDERLESGVLVRPGDQLFLELETDREVWVYVLNADDTGEQNLLYPVDEIELTNPLPPGKHELPGEIDGVSQGWDVTSAGGVERLLVTASLKPLEFIERAGARMHAVVPDTSAHLADADVVGELRGIAGMSATPEERPRHAAGAFDDASRGVALRLGQARGVRVWEWTLANPE